MEQTHNLLPFRTHVCPHSACTGHKAHETVTVGLVGVCAEVCCWARWHHSLEGVSTALPLWSGTADNAVWPPVSTADLNSAYHEGSAVSLAVPPPHFRASHTRARESSTRMSTGPDRCARLSLSLCTWRWGFQTPSNELSLLHNHPCIANDHQLQRIPKANIHASMGPFCDLL